MRCQIWAGNVAQEHAIDEELSGDNGGVPLPERAFLVGVQVCCSTSIMAKEPPAFC